MTPDDDPLDGLDPDDDHVPAELAALDGEPVLIDGVPAGTLAVSPEMFALAARLRDAEAEAREARTARDAAERTGDTAAAAAARSALAEAVRYRDALRRPPEPTEPA